MSAGVLIQWENNEVGLPSPLLRPTGPDGLGWQIRQRIWGEGLSNCEGAGKAGLPEGRHSRPRHGNKGLPRYDYTKGIHIVNVRVTDWIARTSRPPRQAFAFLASFSPRAFRPPLSSY